MLSKTQWQRREGMDASTKNKKLLQIFTRRIEWELRPDRYSYLSVAISHLLRELESDLDHFEERSEMVIAYLTKEFEELFMLPKPQQLFQKHKKKEVVAAFIHFLVQLLSHGIGFIFSFADSINNLKEELRCLVVVLGDTDTTLFGAAEIEENLLAQFEAVANKAGSLVYSFFAKHLIDGTSIGALFEQIELLKANIISFSNLHPSSSIIKTDIITPEAAAVDSFSTIVSLLRDLEELIMNRENDLIVNMKGQINLLHQGLKLSLSFLKDIKVIRLSDIDGLKEVDPNVIHKIKLIEIGIQEIEKKNDIGALKVAKDFSAQPSLHAKQNSDVEDIIVGVEDKTIDILDRLTGGKEHLQTIGIFGMPGLGKTTFAKKLYVHPTVNCYFDKLSWCVVSQAYQRKSVLIDILISLENVAPPNSIIHELPTLSNAQCWELLQKKVFGIETCPPQLLDVGNQIAISCCGLPLAVIVVAGILWTMDREKSAWENVGRSLASYIFADKNNSTMQNWNSVTTSTRSFETVLSLFWSISERQRNPSRKFKGFGLADVFICKHERSLECCGRIVNGANRKAVSLSLSKTHFLFSKLTKMGKRLMPLLNRILVEKIIPPSRTTAGILLPEKTTKLNSGKVVAVGPGFHDKESKLVPVSVKEGDTVLLPEYGGTEVKLGEKEYHLYRDDDILGTLHD
ncbi:hypothetical protein BUALT_Bualt16G0111900 [Buddleja alternifolia]|uniref:Protein groES n=1 Tax=Buddleja alternifolia TaxID=168488 RepID=A0AAV6WLE8_9LAMI|nr:hypothetical protein BUALT_Bualt16G0111900 [Buddleja alternifolia]